uniref:ABC transporter permease n=1 Tax=Pterothamnion crispum TaxID=1550583 RepID=A0A4D6WXR0_9FLOR|nr:hypothetical protein [Pterothamnion crispum]
MSSLSEQMYIVGPGSLFINLLTAFFIGMVFSLQIVKEFLYLNAIDMIGAVLTISFIRELSPVLTSVIIIGRVGSCFTAELATMRITEQIDALYMLGINPILYLVIPRVFASIFMLPILNLLAFATSLSSSALLCFTIYNIDPRVFFTSALAFLSILDICKSSIKSFIFGLIISIISCAWGLSTNVGAKGVGISTTSSVVVSLIIIFIFDFIMSYIMFSSVDSTLKLL